MKKIEGIGAQQNSGEKWIFFDGEKSPHGKEYNATMVIHNAEPEPVYLASEVRAMLEELESLLDARQLKIHKRINSVDMDKPTNKYRHRVKERARSEAQLGELERAIEIVRAHAAKYGITI